VVSVQSFITVLVGRLQEKVTTESSSNEEQIKVEIQKARILIDQMQRGNQTANQTNRQTEHSASTNLNYTTLSYNLRPKCRGKNRVQIRGSREESQWS
jgi:hypothetical protein